MIRTLILTLILCLPSLPGQAASKQEIDARVQETIQQFYEQSLAGRKLAKRAVGMLVFPKVIKGGFILGGEYGEGALLVNRKTVSYYSTAGVSIGLLAGTQIKSQVLMFMDKTSLNQFRRSKGWKVGVDGSVAIAEYGAGTDIDSKTVKQKIIGFIFSNKGLMCDLSLEGSKYTKIKR